MMARSSNLVVHQPIEVQIVTGQDAMWRIIRDLDRKGPWAIADIDGQTCKAAITTIEDYIARLRRGGYIEAVGERKNGNHNTPAKLYRVTIKTGVTPRLRRDGSKAPPSAQAQMWRAMRESSGFTYHELAVWASTPELKIKAITAKSYVMRLADAGLLQLVAPANNAGGLATWRLKRSMNTGPLAPQVLRTRCIFDPNRQVVVGGPVLAENEDEVVR